MHIEMFSFIASKAVDRALNRTPPVDPQDLDIARRAAAATTRTDDPYTAEVGSGFRV